MADSIRLYHRERYDLSIFVVMDDHVHFLLQTRPGHDLSKVLRGIKGATAYAINQARQTSGPLWQKASHTQLMRNAAAVAACRGYIYNNPYQRWGIQPHEYGWLDCFE